MTIVKRLYFRILTDSPSSRLRTGTVSLDTNSVSAAALRCSGTRNPTMNERYLEGLRLFNQHNFFEAHEVLEDVWRAGPEPERKFLQGLIQVAVALHHHSRGNLVGCRSLLDRARRNLGTYPAEYGGVYLGELLDSVARWREALHQGSPEPPLPQLSLAQYMFWS